MSTIARLSIGEYDRMIDSGVFENRRIELINGELREMSPIGVPHEYAVDELTEWSIQNVPLDRVRVRIQHSIGLVELSSVPEPDVAWVARLDYTRHRPTSADVLLLIEVSDSSLAYDRGEKAMLYAQVGVTDYWIVNIRERCVEVRRQPAGNNFEDIRIYNTGETVSPLHLPSLAVPVDMVFGA
ncbi:MAG: Uma2 family endonuclease [Planctomycetes bacterium]|nr:Uma2 family endonuclease [Planctomycetota bacterium]